MHPGWCDTPGLQSGMPDFREKQKRSLRSSEEGSDTIVWLVGLYVGPPCGLGVYKKGCVCSAWRHRLPSVDGGPGRGSIHPLPRAAGYYFPSVIFTPKCIIFRILISIVSVCHIWAEDKAFHAQECRRGRPRCSRLLVSARHVLGSFFFVLPLLTYSYSRRLPHWSPSVSGSVSSGFVLSIKGDQ